MASGNDAVKDFMYDNWIGIFVILKDTEFMREYFEVIEFFYDLSGFYVFCCLCVTVKFPFKIPNKKSAS